MREVSFQAILGDDYVIHVPHGVEVAPGPVEVVIRPVGGPMPSGKTREPLARRLARLAEELDIRGLPPDLAENHDHYLHGLPKGIDNA